jgi:integrase
MSKMGPSPQIQKRIESFCGRYPSEASRSAFRSELKQAHLYTPLSKWTQAVALERLRELQGTHSARSICLKFQRLHTYFNWEIENGLRKSNPVDLKTLPRVRDMSAPQALTADEASRLIDSVPKSNWYGMRDYFALCLMLLHGYRISTVTAINWEDFEDRGDGLYLRTLAKNGVIQSKRLRTDLTHVFEKFKTKTERARC